MASEEITNETAEQPVEAATPAPVAETPAAAVSAPEEIKKPEPRKDIFAELGLGGDDDKPKILKAKGSKNVSTGVVHVSSTFNNTVVTVTDQRCNVIGWSSAGKLSRADVGIDACLFQDSLRSRATNSVNIRKGSLDALLVGYFCTEKACHNGLDLLAVIFLCLAQSYCLGQDGYHKLRF